MDKDILNKLDDVLALIGEKSYNEDSIFTIIDDIKEKQNEIIFTLNELKEDIKNLKKEI